LVVLPKLDKVIGHLEVVDVIAGGHQDSLREDGTIEVEIQAITGATNETGFGYLSAKTY
jgi:glycine reductase complex component B subunits alpha and beta